MGPFAHHYRPGNLAKSTLVMSTQLLVLALSGFALGVEALVELQRTLQFQLIAEAVDQHQAALLLLLQLAGQAHGYVPFLPWLLE